MQKSDRVAGWRCFQGDSLADVFPGPNAFGPGLFCFRPSGDKNVRTTSTGVSPSGKNGRDARPTLGLLIRSVSNSFSKEEPTGNQY